MRSEFGAHWFALNDKANWRIAPNYDPVSFPDGATILSSLLAVHLSDLSTYRHNISESASEENSGYLAGLNDVSAKLKNGVVVVENDFDDEFVVHITPSELLRLLDWYIAIMESADYTNQDAIFEPIEIEYEAVPVGGC